MEHRRLVIVGPAYPYRGGQALVEAYLHNMLSDMGYDCHTVSYKLLYPSLLFPGTTQYDQSEIVPFPHPGRIRHLISSVNPLSWYKAADAIRDLKADAVIFVWWMPFFGPALSTIARLIKRDSKVIFLVENYISHEKRWFDRLFTARTLRHADAFITESAYITRQVTGHFPQKPVHQATLSVYDCYDLHRYTKETARSYLGFRQQQKVILFFGLIRAYKGLSKLIAAFQALAGERSDTALLIAGECYEDANKYKEQIGRSGLQDRILFVNRFIPNEQVELYFKAADLVCLPYESGTQSGILMMAYGFRVPVVVTDVGGIAELVADGKTGRVVAGNAPEQMLPAIREILDNTAAEDYEHNIDAHIRNMGYGQMDAFIRQTLNK